MVNVTAPGRNDPCPCKSGKKYKKCCLPLVFVPDQDDDSLIRALEDDVYLKTRRPLNPVIERIAREALTEESTSQGIDPGELIVFGEPVLAHAGIEREGVRVALLMVTMFWQLSRLSTPALRKIMIKEFLPQMTPFFDVEEDKFEIIAELMVKRHEALFPELHPGNLAGQA